MKNRQSFSIQVVVLLWLTVCSLYVYHRFIKPSDKVFQELQTNTLIPIPEKLYGFTKQDFSFESYSLNPDQSLGELLIKEGMEWDSILKLDKISDDVFSIRRFRARKPFTIVKDSCSAPTCLVYEPNQLTYIKYYLRDSIAIDIIRKNYEICEEQASGEIKSSLWMSMKDAGIAFEMIDQMEDALASDVDFYHTQKGDQFKLVYETKYVDGKPVAYGNLLAASYKDRDGESFAVYFENENYKGFYDLYGQPTKKTFLRAPLKRSRISSHFNPRRFHPIKRRRIPHLGTDYAAPLGTPIYATADGVIDAAAYTKNNGKYIKIKHDNTYTTQYLHMHRFAPGIKKGVRVRQGDVIGQVGMTGLATGPHVCYRFWKNGKQVNHLRENFPPKDPLPESDMPDFIYQRDLLVKKLGEIPYPNQTVSEDAVAMLKNP